MALSGASCYRSLKGRTWRLTSTMLVMAESILPTRRQAGKAGAPSNTELRWSIRRISAEPAKKNHAVKRCVRRLYDHTVHTLVWDELCWCVRKNMTASGSDRSEGKFRRDNTSLRFGTLSLSLNSHAMTDRGWSRGTVCWQAFCFALRNEDKLILATWTATRLTFRFVVHWAFERVSRPIPSA